MTAMTKREAVLSCLEQEPGLMNQTATAIVKAVKKRHGIVVGDNYCGVIKKELRDNKPALPTTKPAPVTKVAPTPVPASPEIVVIDFEMMNATLDVMKDINTLAQRVGGIDNLVLMTTKLSKQPAFLAAQE